MKTRQTVDKQQGRCRAALWQVIRARARQGMPITAPELHAATGMEISSIRTYLKALWKAGYVTRCSAAIVGGDRTGTALCYELARDCGVEAPRLREDGSPVEQALGRLNMWRTMRILRHFSPFDLAVAASTAETTVRPDTAADYCRRLYRAGYLARQDNLFGARKIYVFRQSKYTGPQPPQIQRSKQVYDPNIGKVMWSKESQV